MCPTSQCRPLIVFSIVLNLRGLCIRASIPPGPEIDVVWSLLTVQRQDGLQRLWTHLCRFTLTAQQHLKCIAIILSEIDDEDHNEPLCNSEGEIKGGKVSGFHNWIQFYLLEKSGKLNYYSHSFNGPVGIPNADLLTVSGSNLLLSNPLL